jgi:sugar phosphate isomerase/epimerase
MMFTRRHWLGLAAAGMLPAKSFSHPIGINLYTVRDLLAQDAAATYKRLKDAGISTIEVRPNHLRDHADHIRTNGLKPVHLFLDTGLVLAGGAPLEEMAQLAKQWGIRRLGTSYVAPKDRDAAIPAYGKAADLAAKHGLEIYYHNHAYEFAGEPGQRYIDRLRKELDPRVRLEMDVFWVGITGNSPQALLNEWSGRVKSIHLKDLAKGTPVRTTEAGLNKEWISVLGEGSLDFPAILKAAEKAGVEHYLIELDFTAGDAVDSVARCVKYLRGLNL